MVGTNLLTYKITESKYKKVIDDTRNRLDEISSRIQNKDSESQSLQEEITYLSENIKEMEETSKTQNNCIKMNELKQLKDTVVIHIYTGGDGCSTTEATKMITREIEQTYNYVKGWKENYDKTGMQVWKHSPDLCLYDVERYWNEIQNQYDEYIKYKGLCSQ